MFSLPYLADTNVALGLVAKYYLEGIVEGKSAADALQLTEKAFPTCVSVKSDLEKGYQFWNALYQAIQALAKAQSISSTTLEMFSDANDWFTKNKF